MSIAPAGGQSSDHDEGPAPFFVAGEEDSATGSDARILLISYHFPPGQSVGGLRWQQFSRYARERGWGVDVITLDPEDVETPDRSRLRQLPEGTRVWGVPEEPLGLDRLEEAAWRLYRRIKAAVSRERDGEAGSSEGRRTSVRAGELSWLPRSPRDLYRAFNAWRDHARGRAWARGAEEVARSVFDPSLHTVVVTCGPPHMEHLAGRALKRSEDLPWVMDMRDPWGCMPRLQPDTASPLWLALAQHHERRCVRDADLVVANTEPAREALAEAHPDGVGKMITVMNGFDEDAPPEVTSDDGVFRVAFAGTIYLDRDPRPLFRAVARVVDRLELSADRFRVELMGHVTRYEGRPVRDLAHEAGMEEHLVLHEPHPRSEALKFLAGSEVLLSLPQDLKVAIPSKIFEYMQFPAWILVLAQRESAAERVLRDTRADVVEPGDEEALARVLAERYRQFESGETPRPLADDHPWLSRRRQANDLLDAMERWRRRPADARDRGQAQVAVRSRGETVLPESDFVSSVPAQLPDRPGGVTLVVTIDTEEDTWRPRPGESSAENIRELPRLQEIFDEHGIRPTYLVTYQVVESPWAAEYLGHLHRSGRAEVGCHLHPWNTPPVQRRSSASTTLIRNLEPSLLRSKLRKLIDRIREQAGVEPTSFRAGRWGISSAALEVLVDEGIRTDSSVLPHLEWHDGDDTPAFGDVPDRPYRLDPRGDIQRPSTRGGVVEVPPTVGFTRTPWNRWASVDRAARARFLRNLHLPGLLARAGLLERIPLTPEIATSGKMTDVTRSALDQDLPVLNLFFHSASLLPGATPYVSTEGERDAFLERIRSYLEALNEMTTVRSATLDEVAAEFRMSGRQEAERIMAR